MPAPVTPRSGWCFDPVPPSGARQGGDPAQFVFEPDLSALVRETLQNSNDQLAVGAEQVVVALREVRLDGARLRRLQEAFDWGTLRTHVASVEVAADRFRTGLEMMDGDSIPGLWIEDRGTTGLVGEEMGSGNFAALCRDRLFSEKQRAEAGGSFGLGKAVLWRFSTVSTVAFYSRIAEGPHAGRERFIIKTSLPFHETPNGGEHAGDGWYGRIEESDRGARAVSLWDQQARAAASQLDARPFVEGETGTSILILGFDDPAVEAPGADDGIEARLRSEARRSFWPALSRDRLGVSVGTSLIGLQDATVEARLSAMLATYDRFGEVSQLTNPEQIVVERITARIPAARNGEHPALDVVADVVIQLARDDEEDVGLLWCFRRPGMIIERRDLRQISLAARPFRALLICGEAVRDEPDNRSELEVFLKTAEPPSHDRWAPTPRLKERYKTGWKVGLQRLMSAADEAVRKHVAITTETSEGGPEKLRRLFKVGTVGGGRAESEFHFRDLRAEVVRGAWHFHAKVLPNLPTKSAWNTVVDVEFPEERGRGSSRGTIAAVDVEGADHELVDGRAHIAAPPGTEYVDIHGRTDPRRHPVAVDEAAIELVIRTRAEDRP
jgi:hypothetical protein